MSIYQDNFENIKKAYPDIFEALKRAARKFNLNFFLIGAQCRDVWSNHLSSQKRATRDVDSAVELKDFATWMQLRDYLIGDEKMEQDSNEPYRFKLNEQILDIIPFGGLSDGENITFSSPALVLSVVGLKEVTSGGYISFEGCNVIPIAGLCVMKLISFGEKPHKREKDFNDFMFLLKIYGDIRGESIFEEADFIELIEVKKDFQIAAANILAKEIKLIINSNSLIEKRIIETLENQLNGYSFEEVKEMSLILSEEDKDILFIAEVLKIIKTTD